MKRELVSYLSDRPEGRRMEQRQSRSLKYSRWETKRIHSREESWLKEQEWKMALKMQSMLPKEVERGFYIPSLSDGMEEKCVVQE